MFIVYKAVFVPSADMTRIASPLVLDLDGNGINLYKIYDDKIYYDFDGDGIANLTSRINDGILAMDFNGNGRIDDMTEFFGAKTNGFKELSRYDTPHHIFFKDGIIDKNDAVFSKLQVWQEFYPDGRIHHTEFKKITELGIASISTKAAPLKNVKISENEIRHKGVFKRDDGTEGDIIDAWLTIDTHYTINVGDYVNDPRTNSLPSLRGYGALRHLFIAESLDNDDKDPDSLLMLNMRLTNSLSLEYLLLNWDKVEADVEKILFRWAKADKVDPQSRGPHIDARRLAFYEAYRGEKFRQTGYFVKHFGIDYFGLKNPMPYAAKYTNAIYAYLLTYNTVDLTMQILGKDILYKPRYNLYRDHFSRRSLIKPDGIERIKSIARNADDSDEVWMRVVQIMAYTKGLEKLNIMERFMLTQAVKETSDTLENWQDAVTRTEQRYGKIISSPEDWSSWDKSKEWRANPQKNNDGL